jgi:hypothetical protein
VSETKGKYSVELFKEGGEGPGQEEIVDQHDNLTVARAIYRGRVSQYPGRLVMLCDRARVLARSDRPETMPSDMAVRHEATQSHHTSDA